MTIQEQITVMQHFADGGEVEICMDSVNGVWKQIYTPEWNWYSATYRIKEYTYPMWFKYNNSELVVKFVGLIYGTAVVGDEMYEIGHNFDDLIPHTDKDFWTQIEEPKQTKEVFEWYYKTKDNRLFIQTQLLTEYEAKCYFGKIKYFKTGRSFIVEI